jgi:lipoprotein-anchoring transpeptidase ErfK/SrfK
MKTIFHICRRLLPYAAILVALTACMGQENVKPGTSQAELATRQQAYANEPYQVKIIDRRKFEARYQPVVVPAPTGYPANTILVDTRAKQLYLIGTNGKATRYGIAVGASGHAWAGTAKVGRMAEWPAWYPTDDMHHQVAQLPRRIEPGPANPLGARALYLYHDGVDTLYRIHGTSEPWTIGTEASSGCIRMLNEDIIELFKQVSIGTSVVVI